MRRKKSGTGRSGENGSRARLYNTGPRAIPQTGRQSMSRPRSPPATRRPGAGLDRQRAAPRAINPAPLEAACRPVGPRQRKASATTTAPQTENPSQTEPEPKGPKANRFPPQQIRPKRERPGASTPGLPMGNRSLDRRRPCRCDTARYRSQCANAVNPALPHDPVESPMVAPPRGTAPSRFGQPSSSSGPGPTIISSATCSVRLRIAASSRAQTSGFSLRKVLAFSRPCPIRMLS